MNKTEKPLDEQTISYFSEYIKSFNHQAMSNQSFFLSPQLLNESLKNINMDGQLFSREDIKRMILAPHRFEQELRKLSYHFYHSISIYKQFVNFESSILTFDWEPIPYRKDGKQISVEEFTSSAFQKDYKELTKFFNRFDVKKEFLKAAFNMVLYDSYYVYLREYDDHIYLQELPSTHCIIDADSYLGYLFSFDLSYFTNSGVDINAYSPEIRKKYSKALELKNAQYNANLPQRNGSWVYWQTMTPDNSWVFKFNNKFAGSIPPVIDMFVDYSKIDIFKDLEEAKKKLEAYKVIFATVPRLSTGKMGNKVDDFAISSTELGKFVATVKETLGANVDFKAAPLEDFKLFDFSPSASEKNLLETEINNMMRESGLSHAVQEGGNNVSSTNLYKLTTGAIAESLYPQFQSFCEYQINRKTSKYKFKIKFVGNIFDKDERRKAANEDMERGIITPSIFSSRGIQITDAPNVINMMYGLGFPKIFKPIQTASTMSSKEKSSGGRNSLDDNIISDAGEQTRNIGANEEKKEVT